MSLSRVQAAWHNIEALLQERCTCVSYNFNAPATTRQINAFEKVTGLKLPAALRELYTMRNGQKDDRDGLFFGRRWLSLKESANLWAEWQDMHQEVDFEANPDLPADNAIKDTWWNSSWIPVIESVLGTLVCVDLDPDVGGTVGQLIEVWPNYDDRPLLADSIEDYLEGFYQGLTTGHYQDKYMTATITLTEYGIEDENFSFSY